MFRPDPQQPDLSKLVAQLNVSSIQQTNNPLYQVIFQLIRNAQSIQNLLNEDISGHTSDITTLTNQHYLTSANDSAVLPNSRQLIAGNGITFNDVTANQRTIASAHTLLTSTVITDALTTAVLRGSIVVGNSTPKWTSLPIGVTARVLRSDGNDPSWAQVVLTTDVTGILPVANGGSGFGSYTIGDLLYANTTTTLAKLADVALGSVLISGGVGVAPSWSTTPLVDVLTATTRVTTALFNFTNRGFMRAGSDGVWEFATNGGGDFGRIQLGGTTTSFPAIKRSGAGIAIRLADDSANAALTALSLTLTNALTVPNGGTGLSTVAQGDILYGSAADVLSALAKSATATRYLSNTGASNNPAWAQVDLSNGITGDLPFANFVQATAASKLVGRGSAAGAGDFQEISLGSRVTMTATTLSADLQTSTLLDGTVHTDTVAQTVSRGSLIYGNSTPKWDELVIGSANSVLVCNATDASWSTTPTVVALTTTGDLVIGDQLNVQGVGPHCISGNFLYNGAQIFMGGTFTPSAADGAGRGLFLNSQINAEANSSPRGTEYSINIQEAASGTHGSIVGLLTSINVIGAAGATTNIYTQQVSSPSVSSGASCVEAASLLIIGTPTIGTTRNYSLYIAGGTGVRWGGYGAGAATFDGSGNITSVSDLRFKDVVDKYSVGLAALRNLQPIRYFWNKESQMDMARSYVGFGAQDVQPWVPDSIDVHRKTTYLSFNAHVIIAVLVNAVKELALRVDALDGKKEKEIKPIQDWATAVQFDAKKVPIEDPGAVNVPIKDSIGTGKVLASEIKIP